VRFHFTIQDTGIGVPVDMQMPVMDGIEATQKIRVKELGRRLIRRSSRLPPTLLTTTGANAFDAGMDGYVVKPVSAKAIGDEVGRVMALFIETQPEAVQK
jgi:two-component system sensor histidine kinase/response regulator